MTQLGKPYAHMTSICFSVPGSETSPILLKFLQCSAQISGLSAVFHRKLLDIVKQHPNNAEIWADTMFKPSNQGRHWWTLSSTGTSSQKFGVGKWKKIGVLAIQKVAKTGNIGKKKLQCQAGNIDYVRYLSMQKVNFNYAWWCVKWHKIKSKHTLEI